MDGLELPLFPVRFCNRMMNPFDGCAAFFHLRGGAPDDIQIWGQI